MAGDTSIAIDDDNGGGMYVYWLMAAGTLFNSGASTTEWANYGSGTTWFQASATNDIVTTAGATWQITGVQLEIGEVATPFEHGDFGTTFNKCRRYYQKLGGSSYYGGFHAWTSFTGVYIQLVPPMRAAPTVTQYAVRNGSSGATANANANYISVDGFNAPIDGSGGADTNGSHINQGTMEAAAEL